MPCILLRAGDRPTVDGFSIGRTMRRSPFRAANRRASRAGGTRSGRCGCSVGTSDEASGRRALRKTSCFSGSRFPSCQRSGTRSSSVQRFIGPALQGSSVSGFRRNHVALEPGAGKSDQDVGPGTIENRHGHRVQAAFGDRLTTPAITVPKTRRLMREIIPSDITQ